MSTSIIESKLIKVITPNATLIEIEEDQQKIKLIKKEAKSETEIKSIQKVKETYWKNEIPNLALVNIKSYPKGDDAQLVKPLYYYSYYCQNEALEKNPNNVALINSFNTDIKIVLIFKSLWLTIFSLFELYDLVHNDLSEENIYIDEKENIKIGGWSSIRKRLNGIPETKLGLKTLGDSLMTLYLNYFKPNTSMQTKIYSSLEQFEENVLNLIQKLQNVDEHNCVEIKNEVENKIIEISLDVNNEYEAAFNSLF